MNEPTEIFSDDFWIVVLGGSDSQSGVLDDVGQELVIKGNNDSWRQVVSGLEIAIPA